MKRQRIVPYLYYADGPRAIDYLAKTFGLEEKFKQLREDGTLMHAELGYDDNVVMLGTPLDGSGAPISNARTPRHSSVMCYVEDIDAHYERAVAAGAQISAELETKPYGERMYCATDFEGHVWYFGATA